MRLIKNGEPVFHHQYCEDEIKNTIMDSTSLHAFAVDVLIEEYRSTGCQVSKIERKIGNEADFKFYNKDKSVNVKVFCKDDFNLNKFDISWMVNDYIVNGVFPRIIIADTWCVSDVGDNGKPAVFGGDFCFRYKPLSIIPNQQNIPHEEMSDFQIACKIKSAWVNLDITILEPFIDTRIHYGSSWVFDEIPCKVEYLQYLRGKFNAIKSSKNMPVISLGKNSNDEYALLLEQNNDKLQLQLSMANGYVTGAFMKDNDGSYFVYDEGESESDSLYMGHGDHMECIISLDDFVESKLQKIIQSSTIHCKSRAEINMDDDSRDVTDIFSLRYGDGDLSLLSLIAYSKSSQCNLFVSSYPLMKGYPTQVKVEKVIEWDNLVEATIFVSIHDFSFAFFAVDYYINKTYYIPGNVISVDLSALGMKVEEGQQGFSFEGQKAIDWCQKVGKEPDYDENGNVLPIDFNMENLVAFLPLDSKAPDEAQFQSPARILTSSFSFCNRDFGSSQISIHRFENDEELMVPLFFQNNPDDIINRNVPLKGMLWLTGYITGHHNMESFNVCPKIAQNFVDIFDYSFMYIDKNLMYVLDFLPNLKIKEGYVLNYFSVGSEYGKGIKGYCHQHRFTGNYVPYDEHGQVIPYNDFLKITDLIGWDAANTIPSILNYFDVPFTQEGLMQAWILNNIEEFLPRTWHANYNDKHFIFSEEDIDELFPEQSEGESCFCSREECCDKVNALNIAALLPIITMNETTAILTYSYWSDWNGLVKITMSIEKNDNSVSFGQSKKEILVKYDCGIIF